MGEKYTNIAMKNATKDKLDFLSEKSGLSKTKIMELLLDNIFEVASSFEFLNFDFETSINKSMVYIAIGGKNKLKFAPEGE
jgi:hypothetical protein